MPKYFCYLFNYQLIKHSQMEEKDIDQYLSSFLERLEESDSLQNPFFSPSRPSNHNSNHLSSYHSTHSSNQQIKKNEPREAEDRIDSIHQLQQNSEQYLDSGQGSRWIWSQEGNIETSPESRQRYFSLKKGQRFETHNLGSYFFRSTLQFLKMMLSSNQIDRLQVAYIEEFVKSKGSLKGFQQLFQSKAIRDNCLHFYSSKFVVECILKGGGVGLDKKLVMLKYLEKMRKMLFQHSNGWKR